MFTSNELEYLESLSGLNPIQQDINVFKQKGKSVELEETGLTRDKYLDFSEARVRQFVPFLNEYGGIMDPGDGEEHEYATASFVKAGAILLANDRCKDLQEQILLAMDWASTCLGENKVPDDHADFTTHMLVRAYQLLIPMVDSERSDAWKTHLSNIEPELTYCQTVRNFPDIRTVRNWATYAMHGEMMRLSEGFTDSIAFIDKYLKPQMTRFTYEGLYRDPNLPAAYDLAARQQLSGLIDAGYNGEWKAFLEKQLRKGAQTMLFMQSTTGGISCGGRSNQIIWNELTFANLCEREASLYAKEGDLEWAGVFKRAARKSLQSILRWIEDPIEFRLLKNRFDSELRNGWEFYAYYSTYSLYAAQIAASCYESAYENIQEKASPADLGGYVVPIKSFNRIYATTGPQQGAYHLVMDTAAQMGHDATGWVRLHKADYLEETALSMGIAGLNGNIHLNYFMAKQVIPRPHTPVAIGLTWRDGQGSWHSLADFGRRKHETFASLNVDGTPTKSEKLHWNALLESEVETSDALAFKIRYESTGLQLLNDMDLRTPYDDLQPAYLRGIADMLPRPGIEGVAAIVETYRIAKGGVTTAWSVDAAEDSELSAIGVTVPVLVSNGADESVIRIEGNKLFVNYSNVIYSIKPDGESDELELELLPGLMPNRNGNYRLAQWVSKDVKTEIALHFSLEHNN
ncbi:hypothetical protein [Paenibacillus macquariensis]|uniref:Uncharacterized protein n=1 Tax=Paenibacillus macquariensis TaxID=948756 RepID=A0ABY1JKV1_9BACL|nr:hypothetical protein [Paenibacillus macquariensis]MEC0090012.1 hypothetical protein [Paenibacillus macquariensis]OAB31104.1 hypothetical protein PMSM_20485 [Paenibacillus macquariensis subsp. macquariensis]SIQ36075.1 hypothetical protein SAMN05421578_101399 [Paenibacillus macquariensis]